MINQSPSQFASAVSSQVQNPFADSEYRYIKRFRGIVTENKLQGDGNKIRVTLSTITPLMKGHLLNNPLPMKKIYTDALNRTITSKGTHNNNVIATYYSTDTYRKSPPDVQRGEHVWVWQNGDKKVWYWEPFTQDSISSRRLETVVQAVNADKPTGKDSNEFNETNTYYVENSSHNKTFTISTSDKNGEVTTYMIQINAGKGSLFLKDGFNNFIEINSKDTIVWMKNACGTMYKMDKNNIEVFCHGNYDAKVGQNMSIEVGGNYTMKVKGNSTTEIGGNKSSKVSGNLTLNVSGNQQMDIGGSYTVKTGGTYSHKSSGNKFDSPNTEFTGNVNIGAGLSVKGGTQLGGGGAVQGSLSVSGTLSSSSPVSFPNGGNNVAGYRRS